MLASSSIVLFQACNERIICRDTKTYFHNPKIELTFKYESGMTSRRESHRLIKKDMDSTDFERNFIIDILKISSNETLSKKGIMEIMNQEKILSPKQILNFGLAEKIMNYKQILDLRMEKETYAYVL